MCKPFGFEVAFGCPLTTTCSVSSRLASSREDVGIERQTQTKDDCKKYHFGLCKLNRRMATPPSSVCDTLRVITENNFIFINDENKIIFYKNFNEIFIIFYKK